MIKETSIIKKKIYNHGVTEYVIPRDGVNYVVLLGSHDINVSYLLNRMQTKSIEIKHFLKEYYTASSKKLLVKFDKETLSIYTVPKSLIQRLYKVVEYNDSFKNKNIIDYGYHYHPYDFYKNIAIADRLTKKSLHLKREVEITVTAKTSLLRSERDLTKYKDSK